jgi:hypothetical protein
VTVKKNIVMGGYIKSIYDLQTHFISSRRLIDLYKLNPRECYTFRDRDTFELIGKGLNERDFKVYEPNGGQFYA